jgi:hypothetical protein
MTAAGTASGACTAANAPSTAPTRKAASTPVLRCHWDGQRPIASACSTPVRVLVRYVVDICPRRRTAVLCIPIPAAATASSTSRGAAGRVPAARQPPAAEPGEQEQFQCQGHRGAMRPYRLALLWRAGESPADEDAETVPRKRQATIECQPTVVLARGHAEQRHVARDDAAEHLPQPQVGRRVGRPGSQREHHH